MCVCVCVCGNIKTMYQNVKHQVQWHQEYYWTHHISCMLVVSYELLLTSLFTCSQVTHSLCTYMWESAMLLHVRMLGVSILDQ
jgi:hypothetical protein